MKWSFMGYFTHLKFQYPGHYNDGKKIVYFCRLYLLLGQKVATALKYM